MFMCSRHIATLIGPFVRVEVYCVAELGTVRRYLRQLVV